jgi:phenylacetate-CoA ligase
VLRHGLRDEGPRIRAALLGSEGCTPEQREVIEEAFRTRVYTWYGHSERVILGGECEHTTDYHQFPDYGWLEILDEQGNEVAVGERGEIVGTGFLNRVMPLIRYRTGDYATRLEPRLRLRTQLGPVQRRRRPLEAGNGGRAERRADVDRGAQPARASLRPGRALPVLPGHAGRFEIRVVPDPDFTEADRLAIAEAYAKKVGNEADVFVRTVESIPLTSRGKLKILVSTLDQSQST